MIGRHLMDKNKCVPKEIENFEKSMVYYELYNNELIRLLNKYPEHCPHELENGKKEIGEVIGKIQSQKSTLDSKWSKLEKSLSKYDYDLTKFACKRSIPIINKEEFIVDELNLTYFPIDFESIQNEVLDNIMEMEFNFIDLEFAEVRSKGFQKDMFGCLVCLDSAPTSNSEENEEFLSIIEENQERSNELISELKNCLDKLENYNKNLEMLKKAK